MMASNFQNVIKGHCKILKVLFFGLIVKIIGLAYLWVQLLQGLKLKKKLVEFLGLTEKGIGAPTTGKQIQNFPVTLTVRQSNHMLNAQAKYIKSE